MRERGGGDKGKKDKARIGKAARTLRVLARLDALYTTALLHESVAVEHRGVVDDRLTYRYALA
jgi:hypothetical protein